MKVLKIKREDIEYLEINQDYIEIKYKQTKVENKIDQQEIQDLHEQSGKFGKDSDLSNL